MRTKSESTRFKFNEMVSDDARTRVVRHDSWQFAACLNVLREDNSPRRRNNRENSPKIEDTKFLPDSGRNKESANREKKNSSTRPRGEKSSIILEENKDWNLTNYRKKVNDEVYLRNVKLYKWGDAFFFDDQIISKNNNCKIKEDRDSNFTLPSDNYSLNSKEEIKNCFPKTNGRDSSEMKKTKKSSPITLSDDAFFFDDQIISKNNNCKIKEDRDSNFTLPSDNYSLNSKEEIKNCFPKTNGRDSSEMKKTKKSSPITLSDDAFFFDDQIISKNNNCKIKEDRDTNFTLPSDNHSLNSKEEIKNCFPKTNGRDSSEMKKTKKSSPITLGEEEISNLSESRVCGTSKKLQIIEEATKFSFVVDSKNMYCVSCDSMFANTPRGHREHYFDGDHEEKLAKLKRNRSANDPPSGQLSKLNLFREYMKFSSDSVVCCFACVREIENIDSSVDLHVREELHVKAREKMRERTRRNFLRLKLELLGCDWYKIQKYRCNDCKVSFGKEHEFFEHLENFEEHFDERSLPELRISGGEEESVYEFCSSCALLSYGRRSSSSPKHEDTPTHRMLMRNENYSYHKLPQLAKSLLANVESCVEDTIEARKMLIRDVDKLVHVNYPLVKTRTFRSTVHAANSMNNDVDVFLDCRTMWHGRTPSKDQIWYFMRSVHSSLMNDPGSWEKKTHSQLDGFPIIEVRHRATNLSCGIYYSDGLGIDNTELIKSFNYIFPSYRKLIIFTRQWLDSCDLTGSNHITNYTLYWLVIFHLQTELILPSIAELIVIRENNSDPVTGWNLSASFTRREEELSIKELLARFFAFYANFDFRNDVACPINGEIVKKRDFVDPRVLPEEMGTYFEGVKKFNNQKFFCVDSVMCVQDPFDLSHNLARNVRKIDVCRFRTYCSESLRELLADRD